MDFKKLEKYFYKSKIPLFRLAQVKQAYFIDLAENWDSVSTLPISIRETLQTQVPFCSIAEFKVHKSKDKRSFKAVLSLNDGNKIESVLILYKNYLTCCVSSQVGCAMMCRFCATAQMGFVRNLSSEEIVDQVVFWKRYVKNQLKKYYDKHFNVVFMGMGEPFNNYENVLEAIDVINNKQGLNIGARHISVSTAGIVPKIKEFSKLQTQINLSVSLNAATDNLRKKLMPVASKFSLQSLFSAIEYYMQNTNRKLFVEYVLLKGINDSAKDAKNLAEILLNKKLIHVNLIHYNINDKKFLPTSEKRLNEFCAILKANRIPFSVRDSLGADIAGACGQLVQ